MIKFVPDITLRDYFAAYALQALIAKTPGMEAPLNDPKKMEKIHQLTADLTHSAYRYADSMLATRK